MKEIQISGNAHFHYPMDTIFGLLWLNEKKSVEIPKVIPYLGEWGEILSNKIAIEPLLEMPIKISLLWISLVESEMYLLENALPETELFNLFNTEDDYTHIVIGMAPYGHCSIWVAGLRKSSYVCSFQAKKLPNIDFKKVNIYNLDMGIKEYCHFLLKKSNGILECLPPRNLFAKYMQQFTYRYLPLFEKWIGKEDEKWRKYDEEDKAIPEFEYIEEALYDGTHDKLHDDGLLKYHEAGKPKKLAVKWHVKKSEYTAYFWVEDEEICAIFDKFYGAHRDTKTDLIIHIDVEKNKYELALYRYGLKEPQVIAERAYQLIVFKNKFECYRSENYNQPRGAWIW